MKEEVDDLTHGLEPDPGRSEVQNSTTRLSLRVFVVLAKVFQPSWNKIRKTILVQFLFESWFSKIVVKLCMRLVATHKTIFMQDFYFYFCADWQSHMGKANLWHKDILQRSLREHHRPKISPLPKKSKLARQSKVQKMFTKIQKLVFLEYIDTNTSQDPLIKKFQRRIFLYAGIGPIKSVTWPF